MSDLDRYVSLIRRQQKKIAHVRSIIPRLFEVSLEIGRGQSLNEIARGLTRAEIPPQEGRAGKKWTAQQVSELAYFDGLEPTDDNLWLRLPNAKLGFRVVAKRDFVINREELRVRFGEERLRWEEQRLEKHLADISAAAIDVRKALGL